MSDELDMFTSTVLFNAELEGRIRAERACPGGMTTLANCDREGMAGRGRDRGEGVDVKSLDWVKVPFKDYLTEDVTVGRLPFRVSRRTGHFGLQIGGAGRTRRMRKKAWAFEQPWTLAEVEANR